MTSSRGSAVVVGRDVELARVGRFLDGIAVAAGGAARRGGGRDRQDDCLGGGDRRRPSRAASAFCRPGRQRPRSSSRTRRWRISSGPTSRRRGQPFRRYSSAPSPLLFSARKATSSPSRARSRRPSWVCSHRSPRPQSSSSRSTTSSGSIPRPPGRSRSLPGGCLPRVGLLLTRRGDPAELPPLGLERALPEDRLERLVPRPLSLAALHHLIHDRVGSAPPRPALARLAEASGGNPFLALEIARALGPDWSTLAGGGPLPVPRDLEAIARERVGKFSVRGREASLAAAALSRPTRD